MVSAVDRTIDLRHYLRVLWRRRGMLLLAAVSVFSAALIGLQIVPRQYEAAAVLSIEERVPLSRRIEEVLGDSRAGARPYGYEEQRLARIVSGVRSRPFLERVVKVLRMHEDPKLLERAKSRRRNHPELTVEETAIRLLVEGIQARIAVSGAGPGHFRIAVRDYNPKTAELLARWISELFIDTTTRRELDRIRAQRNFSAEQLRIYEDQVTRAEEAVRRFRESMIGTALRDNPIRSENLPAAEALAHRLAEDESNALARVGARSRAAVDAGVTTDTAVLRNDPAVRALADKLKDAIHAQTVSYLSGARPEADAGTVSADVAGARTDLYRLLGQKAGVVAGATGDAASLLADYAFAQLDAEATGRASGDLSALLSDFKGRVRDQPGTELELDRLNQALEDDRKILESFRAQMVASDIQQAVETTDLGLRVEIVDPAALPLEPSYPQAAKILVLSLLMGPLLGVGFAFLAEMMDPTLRSLDDIRRVVPEPVLGTLPLIDAVLPQPGGLRRRWLPAALGVVVLLTVAFLALKPRLFPDLGRPAEAVIAVEPVEGESR